MKLINEKLLKEKFRKAIPKSSYENCINVTPKMLCDLADECLVDPADLDKMDLAALGMWEKLKSEAGAQYTKAQKRRWRNVEQFFFNLIRAMAKLESAADLKAVDECQDAVSRKKALKALRGLTRADGPEMDGKIQHALDSICLNAALCTIRDLPPACTERSERVLPVKHTPCTDVREKPEVKDEDQV